MVVKVGDGFLDVIGGEDMCELEEVGLFLGEDLTIREEGVKEPTSASPLPGLGFAPGGGGVEHGALLHEVAGGCFEDGRDGVMNSPGFHVADLTHVAVYIATSDITKEAACAGLPWYVVFEISVLEPSALLLDAKLH